ncbi:16S rRNA (guanine(966)-N(2))-methyltransferase RsmD [Crassaminicella thermophila]|uniref:16S rRNA (Guanine(966)-N(2))-methyltransferase RsmD n=1 Tax=Crassaminicella thermophila TaxID=2599308 RepID=A0A5C0SGC6_CRATE|nr:16S rRNA (guanine(966)-N(2))-methyltransferase RsmD [Crassaminicella thermophila]QEK12009.1 16S rRNA (guanine(966)-N(2))-methyltransferase RsmD [Crassaminicella thermophila]
MRVIAGSSKGMRLKAPKGLDTRPTTDRVKEAIFSMINPYIMDSIILDLFAGTGSLGIEALSRGAEKAYFVDNNKNSIKIIKENVEHTGVKEKSTILFGDVQKLIKELASNRIRFDIIFMDPPYLKGLIIPSIDIIDAENVLNKEGIIVVEHDFKDILPKCVGRFIKLKEKKYGKTLISIYSEEE